MQEITVDELRKRGVITETIPGEKRVYRLIKGYEAKNYDGTHAGFQRGTPDGEREIIEQETVNGRKRKYSNWW